MLIPDDHAFTIAYVPRDSYAQFTVDSVYPVNIGNADYLNWKHEMFWASDYFVGYI